MTSQFGVDAMTPEERAQYGAAVAKDAAFDAVSKLWRRRRSENWTRKQAADSIAVDEGWYSKQFVGPRNWTMESFGALVQSLNGELEIIVHAMEDVSASERANYDAYAELEDSPKRRSPPPSSRTSGTKKIELKIEPAL